MFSSTQLLSFLLLVAAVCAAETISLRGSIRDHITALSSLRPEPPTDHYRILPPVSSGKKSDPHDGLELQDIVLVASVDGKFHALNRSTGRALWSMSSSTSSSGPAPAAFGPLVRTQHVEPDLDLADDADSQELYIIEPQSGDIYVMPTPTSSLQRLPFSMSQLVEMSPFSFSEEGDNRLFVGKKETSLLLIELETGRIKKTINSECPWDPFEDLGTSSSSELDLDELESTPSPEPTSTPAEILIGRTDYHISIHTRSHSPSAPRPPVQNLSFSTYGPNNQDHSLQSLYRRTADDTYIQPLPNGEIMSFKTRETDSQDNDHRADTNFLWWHPPFPSPIVAVFDVLKSPTRQQPLILLQPCPRLQDVLPSDDLAAAARLNRLPNLQSAYIGMVESTGSLFTMTPEHFPLLVFRFDTDSARTIDPPEGGGFGLRHPDLEGDLDTVTRARKERQRCHGANAIKDRRCLTGVRTLEESSWSRYSKLLDEAPSPSPEISGGEGVVDEVTALGGSETSGVDFSFGIGKSLLSVVMLAIFASAIFFIRKTGSSLEHPSLSQKSTAILSHGIHNHNSMLAQTPESETVVRNAVPTSIGRMTDDGPVTPRTDKPVEQSLSCPPSTPKLQASPSLEVAVVALPDVADGEEDSERDEDVGGTPKRKGVRRRRGKKKKINSAVVANEDEDKAARSEEISELDMKTPVGVSPVLVTAAPAADVRPPLSLEVSDEILGYGSHGTVVFRGSLQGRAVAVKRLLQDFVTLASREVALLQESDDHPNVIRYYYQEAQANFLYIALELCPASLADVIERPNQFREISIPFNPKRALRQITAGLRHLHALKIVHRDIKPQNILISTAKKGVGESAGHRMLISDFGLCKKLEVDQTSFLPTSHGAMAAGTVGWRAPEILRGEVKLDDSVVDDQSQSSRGSVHSGGPISGKPTRLTKSVDVFALGCLFFYTLTNGSHPFGERFEREVNILKDAKSLNGLEHFGEEGSEAVDLISLMLNPEASNRPDTATCLLHPFFWDPGRRLMFLQDASDRYEIMCRDPREPDLISLEKDGLGVVGHDWHSRLDKIFVDNLGKFRKYDGKSVQDLLRALRNKKHHYQDLPENVKRHLGAMPEGFLAYFTRRFPNLFLHVHARIANSSLRSESMFRTYFELTD